MFRIAGVCTQTVAAFKRQFIKVGLGAWALVPVLALLLPD